MESLVSRFIMRFIESQLDGSRAGYKLPLLDAQRLREHEEAKQAALNATQIVEREESSEEEEISSIQKADELIEKRNS